MIAGSRRVGAGTLVGETAHGVCFWPALSVFPSGAIVTAWLDRPSGSAAIKVRLSTDNHGDVVRDSEIRPSDDRPCDLYRDIAVTALASRAAVVSWTCHRHQADADWSVSLMAQEFDAAGRAENGVFVVNTNSTGTPKHCSITPLRDGGCVVVWSDERCQGGSDIRAALITPDSRAMRSASQALLSTYLKYSEPGRSADRPLVSATPDGGFLALWREGRLASSAEDGLEGRLFDSAGSPQGATFPVEATRGGGGHVMNPAFAVLQDSRFVVSWIESRLVRGSAQPEIDLLARIFTASGLPQGEAFAVRSSFDPLIDSPRIVALTGGGFAVAWEVHGDDATGGIRAQVFSRAGYPVGTELACAGSGMDPRLHALADGGFLLSWSASDGIRVRTIPGVSSAGRDHGLRPVPASEVRYGRAMR